MNEEKKVPFKWEYGEETISLQLGMYANNQRLYRSRRYFLCQWSLDCRIARTGSLGIQ